MRSLLSLAVTGLLATTSAAVAGDADQPQPFQPNRTPVLKNVELTPAFSLPGQFVNSEAAPVAGVEVTVLTSSGKTLVVTDQQGRFEVPGLKGGQCLLKIEDQTYACRLWVNGTAPPGSMKSIAIVQDDKPLIRGQSRFSRAARLGRVNGGQKVALGLLIAGGTTVAIVASETDGS